jgi:hypothetical protein
MLRILLMLLMLAPPRPSRPSSQRPAVQNLHEWILDVLVKCRVIFDEIQKNPRRKNSARYWKPKSDRTSASEPVLIHLDVGSFDHITPFLGLVDDELAEVGGRARESHACQFGDLRL